MNDGFFCFFFGLLKRYEELLNDQEKFKKYLDSVHNDGKVKSRRRFKIPENLRNLVKTEEPERNVVSNGTSCREENMPEDVSDSDSEAENISPSFLRQLP